nr:reverse transcriptase domain-containing protein [Tanacetum cinerariifolium]
MPLSVWEGISLPELTPTCMTLENLRTVQFPNQSVSPKMSHLKLEFSTSHQALIDVHKGELTLRIGNEAITYNLDQTVRYSANYNQMTTNKIDVIESACEEYSQEVLGFLNVIASGTPTHQNDPIISATSPTPTPFGDSDFFLFEEANAFLDGFSGYFQNPIDPRDQEKTTFNTHMARLPTVACLSACAMLQALSKG